jgi:alcohol dehydrogenase class IV
MTAPITDFIYEGLPHRVVFGRGRRLQVSDELARLGCRSPMIICTPEQRSMAQTVAAPLGDTAQIFSEATMHTPLGVTEKALAAVASHGVDCLIAIGGGSAIGLAKAIALRTDLPQIAIPTTYAGSEVTPILGETSEGEKRTQKTLRVLPEVVIYDVDLTMSLPVAFSVTSGINALAHAVEALYAQDGNPIIALIAEQGITAMVESLPALVKNPLDVDARLKAQYGAWLCGTCLGSVGMALHHKVCHVLGGTFDLPHASTHAVILPHALAYTAPAITPAIQVLQRVLKSEQPWVALHALNVELGAPTSLESIGMPRDGIEKAVQLILKNAYKNPRPLEEVALTGMLERAYAGAVPVSE